MLLASAACEGMAAHGKSGRPVPSRETRSRKHLPRNFGAQLEDVVASLFRCFVVLNLLFAFRSRSRRQRLYHFSRSADVLGGRKM